MAHRRCTTTTLTVSIWLAALAGGLGVLAGASCDTAMEDGVEHCERCPTAAQPESAPVGAEALLR